MMNETQSLPMLPLLAIGSERMPEWVKAEGLLVPLNGYAIHIQGASPSGLSPQAWLTVKKSWEMYFRAAGAELPTYSVDCNVER